MLTLRALFSGSNGNCVYISDGKCRLLVDCGVSARRIEAALNSIGESTHNVDALLITHEHSDHILSVGTLSRRYNLPVYATDGTWRHLTNKMGEFSSANMHYIQSEAMFEVKGIQVSAFDTPHDAAGSCGYRFFSKDKSAVVATDIGYMDERMFSKIAGCDIILLESNYDENMLKQSGYPHSLKQRILGNLGHLSNDMAAAVCARLASLGTHSILLGHLSGNNNLPELAHETTLEALMRAGIKPGRDIMVDVAERGVISGEMTA